MRHEKIKRLIHEIKSAYSLHQYQRLSGDRYLRKVPRRLKVLWNSDNNQSFAYCTIDAKYNKYIRGELSGYALYMMLVDLRDALAHEFELINISKDNNRKGCVSHD